MQVGLGFWPSKTLLSAVELELFTELARQPGDAENLQGRLGLHPRSARDFLDTLVALGFLERTRGEYRNTPATEMFLDKRKPSYIGGMLEMANARLYKFWGNLTTALRTGEPQNESTSGGENFFEVLYSDPARLRGFLTAMTGISRGANVAIAASFPWKPVQDRGGHRYGAGRSDRAGGDWRIRIFRGSGSTCRRWDRSSRSTSTRTG